MMECGSHLRPGRAQVAALRSFAAAIVAWLVLSASLVAQEPPRPGRPIQAQENCLTCHYGIEEMHPWEPLTCTDCHGGDPKAETKDGAHVKPQRALPNDERVLPLDWSDKAYLRFKNPANLRVVEETCGGCHQGLCRDLETSLHGTTAGHLSDGMYECGMFPNRGSRYGMFSVEIREQREAAAGLDKLRALPSFDPKRPPDEFATHYSDLAPKNCVRCHLYSTGVALRGRLGFDGDYRGEGCSACHVLYATNGLSQGSDPTVDKFEPGHPIRHQLTSAIPTETCTQCHYGDASVGLNFRGLAQLYPGQPAGPQVEGTTDAQLNRTFYVDDPKLVPPDLHHERGMHCIDCHTLSDVMGDGTLYSNAPQAIEIECEDCHGTFSEPSKLVTSRGRKIENLVKEGAGYFLVSKVDGKKHPVKQAAYVTNARHPDFNPRAADAMKPEHARLECYTCHAAWSPNFFGFHFERQEQFTQLDQMTGERTAGRVNTQEKVFATLRGLYLGFNTDKRIAPYLVGFSSMGSVVDANGEYVLDQVMPQTAAGLSGMTMIHHQLHSTRARARDCADCHRNPTALGLGSPNSNFKLARNFMFVGSARGLDVIGIDRKAPGNSPPIANFPELGVVDVSVRCEPLQGHARVAYLACANRGISVVDLTNPALPKGRKFVKLEDARGVVQAADRLYVAGGKSGLHVFDLSNPLDPQPITTLPLADARDLVLNGPHLYVADFVKGLVVVDVTNTREPRIASELDFFPEDQDDNKAVAIALLHLPSRPDDGRGIGVRSRSMVIAGVACLENGFKVADVTEPKQPNQIFAFQSLGGRVNRSSTGNTIVSSVAASMHVDIGSPDGAIPTAENDYFYVTVAAQNREQGRLVVVKATNPFKPENAGTARISDDCNGVSLMHLYNAPFLQTFAICSSGNQVEIVDVTKSKEPQGVGQYGGLRGAACAEVESFALDRLIDEAGSPQKDISHEGSRFLSRAEVDKILRVDVPLRPAESTPETGATTPKPRDRKPR